jgi:hypothetical protein
MCPQKRQEKRQREALREREGGDCRQKRRRMRWRKRESPSERKRERRRRRERETCPYR